MKQRAALLLALLLTSIVLLNVSLIKNVPAPTRTVTIERIIDGDTFQTTDGETIRLLNINTPEKNQPGYSEATTFLKQYEHAQVEIEEDELDQYGRTLARVYTPEYLNLEMVKHGLAKKFLVDESERSTYDEAEKAAVSQEKGIWKKSTFFDCIDSEIDEVNEKVTFTNTCPPFSLNTFTVADESRKTYIFADRQLTRITLHSHAGNDNQTDVFWNLNQNVWNNDRDTLYLFDDQARLVVHHSYGY